MSKPITIVNRSTTQMRYAVGPAGSIGNQWTGKVAPSQTVEVPVTGSAAYCVALCGDHSDSTEPGYIVADDQAPGATLTLRVDVSMVNYASVGGQDVMIVNDTPSTIYLDFEYPGNEADVTGSLSLAAGASGTYSAVASGEAVVQDVYMVGAPTWNSSSGTGTFDVNAIYPGSTVTLSLTIVNDD